MRTRPLLNAYSAIAIGALLTQCAIAHGQSAAADAAGQAPIKIQLRAEPFALSQVQLLDGPFRDAMQRNADYLLRLEPDRLLARVREFAGLEPKADAYGGWESQGIASHSLGHYLSACALQYAATGDERFKQRVAYTVGEMAECQAAHGDGYATGIPRGREIFAEVASGDIRSQGFDLNGGWVPWYTMHKLLAGLRDAWVLCELDSARDVLAGLADYCWTVVDDLDEDQMQRMLACEHGGMNEVAADLYALTGEPRYLQMAEKFYHKAVLDSLAAQQDRLAGLHANTQAPKVIGAARLHELTGDARWATIARFFWNRVVHHYSYVNGGNSFNEHFGPPDQQRDTLHDTTETCNTYNMLKLTRHLFSWRPSAELMDYYERALLNHILAHQHRETGMYVYKGFLDHATHKQFSTPFDSFWCCVGSGMENHAKYGESIYFHTADALYVNLFISSQLAWPEMGLKLTQKSEWPNAASAKFVFELEAPREFAVWIRYPDWAQHGIDVRLNDRKIEVDAQPGSYMESYRMWRDGDQLAIDMPMALRFETMPDDDDMFALFYGPTLLAAVHEDRNDAPALVAGRDDVLNRIRRKTPNRLEFTSDGLARPNELRLIPLFDITDQRYTVYLRRYDLPQWQAHKAELAAEREHQAKLAARTVDFFQPGEMQPERDHALTGENIRNGRHSGRAWRDAYDGGWFSFEMAVDPVQPVTLVCTYWGSDAGGRTFDILVDGEKLGTQTLDSPRPNEFIDIAYPVPPELSRGKQRVTVRLQALPGNMAGGLFGCRMLRGDEGLGE